jgi:predicted glycosyltransferase involved in capsule biosynthesis
MITICLSYYNQVEVVKQHIKMWLEYDEILKKEIEFIIIDDCSKVTIDTIVKDMDLSSLCIHIYRVTKDLVCNIGGVRNLSAQKCTTQWMLIIDMDTLVSETMAHQIVELAQQNKDKTAYKFNRKVKNNDKHIKHNKLHPAVSLIRNDDYWNVGGCDEDLVGHYGQTDPMFWYRAKDKIHVIEMKNIFLDYIEEGESDITRDKTHNKKLFEKKKKTKIWSADFIRFPYVQIL